MLICSILITPWILKLSVLQIYTQKKSVLEEPSDVSFLYLHLVKMQSLSQGIPGGILYFNKFLGAVAECTLNWEDIGEHFWKDSNRISRYNNFNVSLLLSWAHITAYFCYLCIETYLYSILHIFSKSCLTIPFPPPPTFFCKSVILPVLRKIVVLNLLAH